MRPCLPLLSAVAALALAAPLAAAQDSRELDAADGSQHVSIPSTRLSDPSTIERYRAALGELEGMHGASLAATGAELISLHQAAVPESTASPRLVVDGPPEIECPNAAFASIQAAVAAAPPGGTIKVCPGQYNESVVVQKPLTLTAPRQMGRATRCPSDAATDPTRYAIVDSPGFGDGLRLQADGIVLEGFVAQGNLRGIVTDPAFSGYLIRHTIAQNNTIGITFRSSGALESTVERSCLRGASVALNSFVLRRAQVEGNEVTHNGFGMALVNSTDVGVIHNDVSDSSGTGVFISLGTNVSLLRNHVARSGAGLVHASSTGVIASNLIEHAADIGISLLSDRDVRVRFNHVRESGVGVRLLNADGNTLRGNEIRRSDRDGVVLVNSDANALGNNLSRDNGADGLHVTSQSSGNAITRNTLLGNDGFDCYDDTVGAGTAGTANFWIANVGRTENRPGLCRGPDGLPGP